MNKYLVLLIMGLGLASCTTKDESYYQSHPNELQQAIKTCQKNDSAALTCQQLNSLAHEMNELAYQLQLSPQKFGIKIVALQETIAQEQQNLKTQNNVDLQADLERNQRTLARYLAIVKWLESPAS